MAFYANYEKLRYSIIDLPDTEWKYSYSAKAFQRELNALFTGQKIESIYVTLDGYLKSMYSEHSETNLISLSFIDGLALVVFEKTVLELVIHVEGMIKYRHFPIWEMNLHEVFDYPPDDMEWTSKYLFDVADHEITYDYTNERVNHIVVKGTDIWGFPQSGYDIAAAKVSAQKKDLPKEIALLTDDCAIRFVGNHWEYYYIIFEGLQKQGNT